jgi:hypothetical protein
MLYRLRQIGTRSEISIMIARSFLHYAFRLAGVVILAGILAASPVLQRAVPLQASPLTLSLSAATADAEVKETAGS